MSDEKEISLSIEETNALRVKLGLKPLNDDKKKDVVLVDTSKTPATSNDEGAVKARLDAAKKKREEKERANRRNAKAISDQASAAQGSAKDWVKASRLNAAKRKEENRLKREEEAKNKKEDKYDETDLEGINVKHKMDAFEEVRRQYIHAHTHEHTHIYIHTRARKRTR